MAVTRRWTVGVMACLAAATVLSGCSAKQPANETLPSTSSSAAPTTPALPPLGPQDMPMPDEARTQDAAGAEAFVRYYIELINRTSDVMDAAPLRDLSDGCRDCDRIASNTEKEAAAGHDYEGGEITITEVMPPLLKETTASIAISIDQAPLIVIDPSGSPIRELGSEAYSGLPGGVGLTWNADLQSWLITDFTVG
jgi:hypothetical protein